MSKRKTVIELQSKPQNKSVRQIIEKTNPVNFAPISQVIKQPERLIPAVEQKTKSSAEKTVGGPEKLKDTKAQNAPKTKVQEPKGITRKKRTPTNTTVKSGINTQTGRLRIFQTSTPVTRTTTSFQKVAIVVRGENGKELIELLWRDQMNEKTKDIWDYLRARFTKAEEESGINEVTIRKRDILEGSGVKSDRTFISAIYTLEDMGLIEVQRLSGNKEGNIYILTEEGREEIDNFKETSV